jgi:hypothetical protein
MQSRIMPLASVHWNAGHKKARCDVITTDLIALLRLLYMNNNAFVYP